LPEQVLNVTVQGMDRGFRYTGSYDEVNVGGMPLDDVLRLIDYIAGFTYPPNYKEDDLCPIGVFIEGWGANLLIYYYGSGSFGVRIIDYVSSSDIFLEESAGAEKVKDYVRRFFVSRSSVEELLGPEPLREYFITVLREFCEDDLFGERTCVERQTTATVSMESIAGVSTPSIVRVEVRRGGFLRKPKLTIYYSSTKGSGVVEYKLPNNDAAERAYRAINAVIPGKVSMR